VTKSILLLALDPGTRIHQFTVHCRMPLAHLPVPA